MKSIKTIFCNLGCLKKEQTGKGYSELDVEARDFRLRDNGSLQCYVFMNLYEPDSLEIINFYFSLKIFLPFSGLLY